VVGRAGPEDAEVSFFLLGFFLGRVGFDGGEGEGFAVGGDGKRIEGAFEIGEFFGFAAGDVGTEDLVGSGAGGGEVEVFAVGAPSGVGGGVVATVMSNLGLENHLKSIGVKMERTQVGDRYVVARMLEKGLNVGGEQSGHVVLSDFSTTGDGLLAALQVLAVMVETGKKLSEVAHVFDPAPQKLVNRKYTGADPLSRKHVQDAIAAAEKALGTRGRLLVRKSGTEPLIRVMAQAETDDLGSETVDGVLHALDRD